MHRALAYDAPRRIRPDRRIPRAPRGLGGAISRSCDSGGGQLCAVIRTGSRAAFDFRVPAQEKKFDDFGQAFGSSALRVTAVLGEATEPFASFVGDYEIVSINVRSGDVFSAIRLHRSINDDPGFFWLHLIPLAGGFIAAYESGVVRIDGGWVSWSVRLWWDVFISADESRLYFIRWASGGSKELPFAVRIDDGAVLTDVRPTVD